VLDGSTCPTEQFPSYPIAPKSGTQGQWIQQVSCGAWPVPDLSVLDASKRQAYLWLGKDNLCDSAEPRETSDSRSCTGQRPIVFHLFYSSTSWVWPQSSFFFLVFRHHLWILQSFEIALPS